MISIDYITLTTRDYNTGRGSYSRKMFYMIGAGFIKSLLGIKISEVENIEVQDKSAEVAILAVYFKNGKKILFRTSISAYTKIMADYEALKF